MSDNTIWLNTNVYEEAKKRIRYIFDEFDKVVVAFSGGKDSTVTLFTALEVAREKGKLPLTVMWIDQEAEWNETVEYARYIQGLPDIDFRWHQHVVAINNSTSHNHDDEWLISWEPGKNWIREKEEDSVKENDYGTTNFYDLFGYILRKDFPGKSCMLGGVRAEESPARRAGLTNQQTYKHITYGKKQFDGQCTFYPLYDWGWKDVWKYIHDNKLVYNKIYDYQFQYGIKVHDMRVSALSHETAVKNLFYLPEVDRELYDRLQTRLKGINTCVNMKDDLFVKDLPFMFTSWIEYRDFLLEKLVEPANRPGMQKHFKDIDRLLEKIPMATEGEKERIYRGEIQGILVNDIDGTKFKNLKAGYLNQLKFKYGLHKTDNP